ncbi:hypothetical protein AB4Y32_16010 [Paraburkholderia phymatum]|uniref:Uncharacterized protein n=1 Tax=Paraburkholderia phymatum TaxID=148447 RepID=A0ACC6U128_9BURK
MAAVSSSGRPIETVEPPSNYQVIPASTTATLKTASGNVADYIENLICVVSTAATAQVQLQDGSGSAFTVFPNSPGGGVGTYVIRVAMKSNSGSWKVTTGAGVSVIATGAFS